MHDASHYLEGSLAYSRHGPCVTGHMPRVSITENHEDYMVSLRHSTQHETDGDDQL